MRYTGKNKYFEKYLESMVQDTVGKINNAKDNGESISYAESLAVCRITTSYIIYDWMKPYNKTMSSDATGTGFVVKGHTNLNNSDDADHFLLFTAYHVVEFAKQINVRIEADQSMVITSKLLTCNPDLDVAVLIVPIKLPSSITPLSLGESDSITPLQPIQAVGYALGSTHLQFTTGVISGRISDRIQIDAAINKGNSGGPLIDKKTKGVVGVVVSARTSAQNVNYACPIQEALESLKRMLKMHASKPLNMHRLEPSFDVTPSTNFKLRTTQVISSST